MGEAEIGASGYNPDAAAKYDSAIAAGSMVKKLEQFNGEFRSKTEDQGEIRGIESGIALELHDLDCEGLPDELKLELVRNLENFSDNAQDPRVAAIAQETLERLGAKGKEIKVETVDVKSLKEKLQSYEETYRKNKGEDVLRTLSKDIGLDLHALSCGELSDDSRTKLTESLEQFIQMSVDKVVGQIAQETLEKLKAEE